MPLSKLAIWFPAVMILDLMYQSNHSRFFCNVISPTLNFSFSSTTPLSPVGSDGALTAEF
jgi:hypothetical protein